MSADVVIIKQHEFYKEYVDTLYTKDGEPDVCYFTAKKDYTSTMLRRVNRDLELMGCSLQLVDGSLSE